MASNDAARIWVMQLNGNVVTGRLADNAMNKVSAYVKDATELSRVRREMLGYTATMGSQPPEVTVPTDDIISILPD